MRYVMVDSIARKAKIFNSLKSAMSELRVRAIADAIEMGDLLPEDKDSYPDIEEYVGMKEDLLILEEGKTGVWTGFSSSDRATIGGSLPPESHDEWMGNGDLYKYETVGKAVHSVVDGVSDDEPELWQVKIEKDGKPAKLDEVRQVFGSTVEQVDPELDGLFLIEIPEELGYTHEDILDGEEDIQFDYKGLHVEVPTP